jgi:hypothetical protein
MVSCETSPENFLQIRPPQLVIVGLLHTEIFTKSAPLTLHYSSTVVLEDFVLGDRLIDRQTERQPE